MQQKNALLSVFHKDGITEFAQELINLGLTIYASGGTFKKLIEAGLEAKNVAELVGGGAILGHRVVTLSREVHAGLLAKQVDADLAELEALGIPFIDLVCVDLYPLEQAINEPNATLESITEMTDIGGPTMLRAGAKGRRITIGDVNDYQLVLAELKEQGDVSAETRLALAAKAEFIVARYVGMSADALSGGKYKGIIGIRQTDCKGENAWQGPAAVYSANFHNDPLAVPGSFILIAGEKPSAINWFDLNRALQTATHLAAGFDINFGKFPELAIGVKHNNACGVGMANTNYEAAITKMLLGDPLAIFGGFVLVNFAVNEAEAELLVHGHLKPGEKRRPLDGIAAPIFSEKAIEILSRKEGRCRLLANPALASLTRQSLDTRPILRTLRSGFVLEPNQTFILNKDHPEIKVYPEDQRDKIDWESIVIAWAIGSTSNSNTITIVSKNMLCGNGVGQQDRVACAELAGWRAKRSGLDINGATAYSDSFFPFPDGPMVLAEAGIKTIFTSSGSMRDQVVINACLEKGVTLVMCPDAICRGFAFHC